MKSGFVSIIGKPNVGKSTLLNSLIDRNLSIITKKPQTTRHKIIGIRSEGDNQIVLIDTPGIFKPKNELDKAMQVQIKRSFEGSDIVLIVISPQQPDIHYEMISQFNKPVFLLINKIDTISSSELDEINSSIKNKKFKEIIPISALTGENLHKLISLILKYLPSEHPFYPEEYLSDRPERFFISEITREKIFEEYKQEIPYSTTVEVVDMENGKIDINIYVEKESQKGIIIGKNGKKLKKVVTLARVDIEKFLGKHIYLKTWVKVRKNWRKNKNDIRRFGYYE
jgi:GTP-binding protein Era